MLSLSVALVCVQITSVKLAASRAQIAGALDIGMYSLFAQYDQELLENYELFYLDGSFGSGSLNMGRMYDVVSAYMEPVLEQNFTELELESGGWTGYQLATDDSGASFYRQAVEAERLLLADQGIQLLLGKVQSQTATAREQEQMQESRDKESILEQYDTEIQKAAEASEETEFTNEEPAAPPADLQENPIDVIRRIQKMGILELVLEQPQKVSGLHVEPGELLSGRSQNQGMPMGREAVQEGTADGLLFQEYLLNKCGNFLQPGNGSLAYQTEYILFGEHSDVENLKKTVNRILLLREGANLIHLYSDGEKSAQAGTLASGIAAAFLIPVAEPVIRLAILACWAFGESILDVRELLAGGKIALVKDKSSWQLSLENLPKLLEHLDSDRKEAENGLTYQDYLRILLFMQGKEEKLERGMDMVECSVRAMEGKQNFRLDCCIAAAEISVDVRAGMQKSFTGIRAYTYEQAGG